MRRGLRTGTAVAAILASAAQPLAATGPDVPIEERVRGAARVVVASVSSTTARYERNEFGDELIVTYAQLIVEEALKGGGASVVLALEGGTVQGITLRVSDLPTLSSGERAVFFLTPGRSGEFKPHLRGQGILKLDPANRVRGSSLTLDEIRRIAAQQPR